MSPSLTTPNGETHLVWRQGSDHYAARDGEIWRAISTDNARTYDQAMRLRIGGDYRDPCIGPAGDATHLTWFAGTSSNPAAGVFAMREWGPTIRVDTALARAAVTAPVVELPNGELGIVFYGRKSTETRDTCWMAWSSNDGRTWTGQNRITTSSPPAVTPTEPWPVVDGDLCTCFYRGG